MYKPITIKDIARALALSPSTVSRALSNSYEINEETKKRVLNMRRNTNIAAIQSHPVYDMDAATPLALSFAKLPTAFFRKPSMALSL